MNLIFVKRKKKKIQTSFHLCNVMSENLLLLLVQYEKMWDRKQVNWIFHRLLHVQTVIHRSTEFKHPAAVRLAENIQILHLQLMWLSKANSPTQRSSVPILISPPGCFLLICYSQQYLDEQKSTRAEMYSKKEDIFPLFYGFIDIVKGERNKCRVFGAHETFQPSSRQEVR